MAQTCSVTQPWSGLPESYLWRPSKLEANRKETDMMIRETKKRTFANGHRIKCGNRSWSTEVKVANGLTRYRWGKASYGPQAAQRLLNNFFFLGQVWLNDVKSLTQESSEKLI